MYGIPLADWLSRASTSALVETKNVFTRTAQRSVCVNGSIEIHVVTSTSAAQPSAADRKITTSCHTAQRSGAQPSPAQHMCERTIRLHIYFSYACAI